MRRAGLAIAAFAFVVASAPLAGSAVAQGGDSPRVLVSTTGNQSELRNAVPITKREGAKPRTVMSMGPDLLPSLEGEDKLQVTGEVEVTTDCLEKSVRCVGRPYGFNPIVNVRVILATSPATAGGVGTLELGAQRLRCRQKLPDREHHCVFTFTNTVVDIAAQSQLPCGSGTCHLNMVVSAHNRRVKAKKGYKLLIGEDEPDGSVVHDKGRLNAVRFDPADQPGFPPVITNTALLTGIPIRKGGDVVVYSQELTGLRRDDQIAANATMPASIAHLPYNALIRSRLILAPSPADTAPGKEVKELTEPKGELAEANGFNCTQRNPTCVTSKVGVITMRKKAEDEAGEPIPLYANLVVDTAKPGATAPAGDVLQVLPGGGLGVVTYPAYLRG